ncbi:MAG: diaminopimelate epimerase [Microscillaceae bacterium]|nr:diaminopimelate epimerase [Microscillaceae bacterium]
MNMIHFHKYQGTGNDFILIDNRDLSFDLQNQPLIRHLCHRRFGVGADGLILLEHALGYDFKMVYFNADGSEGSMCGNGGRCTVRFAESLGLFRHKTHFLAIDGPHEAFVNDQKISLKMIDVSEIEQQEAYYFLNTGSPHYVESVQDLENFPVFQRGKAIRYSKLFADEGTNVNFVESLGDHQLFVRTYERGVEDETFSCGTGVTACALVFHQKGMMSPIRIKTLGGDLEVSFEYKDGVYQHIFLSGPAEKVFEGFVSI